MSGPFAGHTRFALRRVGDIAEVRLGKMLQAAPATSTDRLTAYLRAGSLASLARLSELPEMYASPREIQQYSVRPGDLLVSEGGDVGRTAFVPRQVPEPTIIQNSLHRMRPRGGDVRYLRYALDVIRGSGWLDVLCNRSTFGHLTVEKLSAVTIPYPSTRQQRVIADHLDNETTRIDALISKKQRLDRVLGERRDGLLHSALADAGVDLHQAINARAQPLPEGWQVLTLGRVLTQLTNGYVGPTRDILVDSGVQYIQGTHIKSGRIDFARRPFFVTKEWHLARPRISLSRGDVLIVQTGDIGQVAVVPEDLGPASCHALLIARPNQKLVSSDFLAMYLQSPTGRHELLRLATGALHPHLEFGIKAAPVLLPPLDVQEELVETVRNGRAKVDGTRLRLGRQVRLLEEHRQAVITAAVTGELEIAGVV